MLSSLHVLAAVNISPPLKDRTRINHQIRSAEVRLIGAEGENRGVVALSQALAEAQAVGLDLIEISPMAVPPVAKIADYGKFQYEQNKKERSTKAKAHEVEVKNIQVKIGTGEHDLDFNAKESRNSQMNKRRAGLFVMVEKSQSRFLGGTR